MRHTHSEPPTVASAWMLVQGVNNKVHGACAALPYMRQRPRRALDWVGVLGRAGQSWAGSLCWSPRPGWVGPGAWVGGLDRAGLEDWAGRWEERGAAQRLLLAAAADSLSAGGAAAEGRWTLNHNPHVNGVRCSRAPRVRRRRGEGCGLVAIESHTAWVYFQWEDEAAGGRTDGPVTAAALPKPLPVTGI